MSRNALVLFAGLAGCTAEFNLREGKPSDNLGGPLDTGSMMVPVDTGTPLSTGVTEGEAPSVNEYFDQCLSHDPCGDAEPECTAAFIATRDAVQAELDEILAEGGSVLTLNANFYGATFDDRGAVVYSSSQNQQGIAVVAGKSCTELTADERLAIPNYAGFLEGVDVPMAVNCRFNRSVSRVGALVEGGISWGSGQVRKIQKQEWVIFIDQSFKDGAPARYDTTTSHFANGGEWPREDVRTYATAFTADEMDNIVRTLRDSSEAIQTILLGAPVERDTMSSHVEHPYGYFGNEMTVACYPLSPSL